MNYFAEGAAVRVTDHRERAIRRLASEIRYGQNLSSGKPEWQDAAFTLNRAFTLERAADQ